MRREPKRQSDRAAHRLRCPAKRLRQNFLPRERRRRKVVARCDAKRGSEKSRMKNGEPEGVSPFFRELSTAVA